VPKYYASPTIEFSGNGYDSTTGVLTFGTAAEMTLTCRITNCSVKPEFFTTCDGYFTSELVNSTEDETGYTYVLNVARTTAMTNVGDLKGKLTVYVPYFESTTKMAQVTLNATAPFVEIMRIPGDKKDLTFSFRNLPVDNNIAKVSLEVEDFSNLWINKAPKDSDAGSAVEGTFEQKFILDMNTTEEVRECTVNFYNRSGQLVDRRTIEQQPLSASLDFDLAANGSANCYIISQPGRYRLPLVQGNSTTPVAYSSAETISINGTNNFLKVVAKAGDHLYFDVLPKMNADGTDYDRNQNLEVVHEGTVANGNTLLKVKDGDDVAWSWHLWFYPGGSVGEKHFSNSNTLMDRALGSESSDIQGISDLANLSGEMFLGNGLYYKWGSRNPLVLTNGTYVDYGSTEGGTWSSSTKSKNDPCPPGYRIPSSSAWKAAKDSDMENYTSSYAFAYNTSMSDLENQILFPYTYKVNSSGNYVKNDWETMKNQDGSTTLKSGVETGSVKIIIWNVDYSYWVEYTGRSKNAYGAFWDDSGAIYYDALVYDLHDIKVHYTSSLSKYIPDGSVSVNDVKSIPYIGERIASTVEAIVSELKESVIDYRHVGFDVDFNGDQKIDGDDISYKQNGLQVRCVKE
jgi:hypothetical protein